MRFPALVASVALFWPTVAAAHGGPTDHIHPHGDVVVRYQALLIIAGLTVAVGIALALRQPDMGGRFRRAIQSAMRLRGPKG